MGVVGVVAQLLCVKKRDVFTTERSLGRRALERSANSWSGKIQKNPGPSSTKKILDLAVLVW